MTAFGFILVLAAALCHAIWNFFVKRINGGSELVWLFSVISVLIYLPVALYILIFEKPTFGYWEFLFITGSAALHLGYFLLLQAGYRKGDLSLVYPTARATGPFLSTSLAVLFLGEKMTLQIALGAAVVIVGVICLTGGFKAGAKNLTASLSFGVGAGLLIGIYTVWDAYAVSILLAPVAAKNKEFVKNYWREYRFGVVAIAIFNPLAYILVLYALTFTLTLPQVSSTLCVES